MKHRSDRISVRQVPKKQVAVRNFETKKSLVKDSEDLWIAISFKIKSTNTPVEKLAGAVGVPVARIMRYLNGDRNKSLTEEQIILLANAVGISVELKIVLS